MLIHEIDKNFNYGIDWKHLIMILKLIEIQTPYAILPGVCGVKKVLMCNLNDFIKYESI